MNLPRSELLFLLRPRRIDFVLVLSATSLSKELIFTTLLKACGTQNHSCIYLRRWLMEEYITQNKLNQEKHKTRLLLSTCYLISAAEVKPTKRQCFK